MTHQELVDVARQAREFAHAPFSHFKVGAALETVNGEVVTGCNVENSSYGLSMCAERVAVFKAISNGLRDFKRIAVIADSHAPVRPCGACRQIIWEMFPSDAEVVLGNLLGEIQIAKISDLLPAPFDRSFL